MTTLEERLVVAADDDRRRIERELHDGVQQQLVALAVNLQLAERLVAEDPPAARALLEALGRDVQQALEDVAQLAQRIHPPLLEASGLGAALRAAAHSAGVPSSVEVAAEMGWGAEALTTVYLCWLGALDNASAGTTMTIAVRAEDDSLSFEIGGSAPLPDRFSDRVEALGGELVCGGGRVAVSLPI